MSVKDYYDDGLCPDCQLPIPDDAVDEQSCENCGHVFYDGPEVEWDVEIEATVRKTIRVTARSEEEATQEAHSMFTVANEEDEPEDYNENCLSCEKVVDTTEDA